MPVSQNIVSSISQPIQLLRRIRSVLVGQGASQERLNALVRVISQELGSDVCSIYLLRAGDVLELFATVGLKQESIHRARLPLGEGLVGEIGAHGHTLNLANASSHPSFKYLPETGEEAFKSFVGVPIVKSSRVIGVLVVQGRTEQLCSDEQLEVLHTVAMLLAEMFISESLINLEELDYGTGTALLSQRIVGARLAPGMAKGPAVVHHRMINIRQVIADDSEQEQRRMDTALREMQHSIAELIASKGAANSEHREILESYQLLAQDHGWQEQLRTAMENGLTAEAAVKKVQEEMQLRFSQVASPYIRERIHDLNDLSYRLLQHLTGQFSVAASAAMPQRFILVAEALGPAELLEYEPDRILGLILDSSSPASHAIIIARALDIPVVGKVKDAVSLIQDGDTVVVDGDSGEVYIRPSEDIQLAVEEHIHSQTSRRQRYSQVLGLPAITRDGVPITLQMNAGLVLDMKQFHQLGLDGIGLYRTELPYMTVSDFPDMASQRTLYRNVLEDAAGKPVLFRTFDIGGDKPVSYIYRGEEENPAMGWRASRIGLDRPSILRRQLRALLEAGAGHHLHLMFPFICEVDELDRLKEMVEAEKQRMTSEGVAFPDRISMGAMIEIPSILWQLDALFERVDFVSIGSNDLMQFLYACDRGNLSLSDRYDALNPVFLRIIQQILEAAAKKNRMVSFCGEMARRPLDAMALIGLGVRSLSVSATAVGPLKAMIRSLDSQEISHYLQWLLQDSRYGSDRLRGMLKSFAQDHQIAV